MDARHFLVVEDHEFQRQMLERALLGLGALSVRAAANGAQAVRLLRAREGPLDVVISDLMMPDVDGIELLPMLKQLAPDVALVLCSADEAVLHTAAALANAHGLRLLGAVAKPVTAAKLQPLLESYRASGAA